MESLAPLITFETAARKFCLHQNSKTCLLCERCYQYRYCKGFQEAFGQVTGGIVFICLLVLIQDWVPHFAKMFLVYRTHWYFAFPGQNMNAYILLLPFNRVFPRTAPSMCATSAFPMIVWFLILDSRRLCLHASFIQALGHENQKVLCNLLRLNYVLAFSRREQEDVILAG